MGEAALREGNNIAVEAGMWTFAGDPKYTLGSLQTALSSCMPHSESISGFFIKDLMKFEENLAKLVKFTLKTYICQSLWEAY
jgi:hypothetical protein